MAFMEIEKLDKFCRDSIRRSKAGFEEFGPILD